MMSKKQVLIKAEDLIGKDDNKIKVKFEMDSNTKKVISDFIGFLAWTAFLLCVAACIIL